MIEKRKTGTVKWFDDRKGYGFIEADGVEYFAHYSKIEMTGYKTLSPEHPCTFVAANNGKGPAAECIRPRPYVVPEWDRTEL